MKSRKNSMLLGWFGASTALLLAAPASAAEVDVTITGINSAAGIMLCRIFNETSGFPISGASLTVYGNISDGTSRCNFAGLPEGRYAVAVLHDANSNGKLDKNLLGRPTEGLAFSQTGKPMFGVPSFSSAAFKLGAAGSRLTLRVVYP